MKNVLGLTVLLAIAAPTCAHAQVLGLLTLPEVFGSAPCDTFVPSPIPLHSAPRPEARIGRILTERAVVHHATGGCEPPRVVTVLEETGSASPLPVHEYTYEVPAAVVLEHQARWFRIRLHEGSAWIHASAAAEFHPLDALLTASLSYVALPRAITLSTEPGGETRGGVGIHIDSDEQVRVREARWLDGRLWLRVERLSHSVCEGETLPTVTGSGWIAAHTDDGDTVIWFHSRGC
jgi:hypothetical protein